ncbi:hypothetical protein BDZ91DRAFT_96705 [Kalaharituber pfeilii]|nr:hypothetical protein BDZ91DRAFT_96705 [Kalaharituber pfeilii]
MFEVKQNTTKCLEDKLYAIDKILSACMPYILIFSPRAGAFAHKIPNQATKLPAFPPSPTLKRLQPPTPACTPALCLPLDCPLHSVCLQSYAHFRLVRRTSFQSLFLPASNKTSTPSS